MSAHMQEHELQQLPMDNVAAGAIHTLHSRVQLSMDWWHLDSVLPPHPAKFYPLEASEVRDALHTMPMQLSCRVAAFLWEYLRGMQIAWKWFYVRNYDLQQYFKTFREVLCQYPIPNDLPLTCHASEKDARFWEFLCQVRAMV